MCCSGCSKNISFTGTVCPYGHRDKSKDQKYMVLGFAFLVWDSRVLGAIGGFVIGASLAYYVSGAGNTKAPDVELKLASEPDEARLQHLKTLYDRSLIDEGEHKKKREIFPWPISS